MKQTKNLDRRRFIKLCGGASLMLWQTPTWSALNTMATSNVSKNKIVWVILRGALDSIHTVVPTFEKELVNLRPSLSKSYNDALLPLDNGFALHPSLKNCHKWYVEKAFSPVVAVSSGYSERSHFDGQDFLESGKPNIDHNSGWLARAIDLKHKKALAVAQSTPVTLRGSESVNTWYPSNLKESDDDIYAALINLYQDDPILQSKLEEGLITQNIATMGDVTTKKKGNFVTLAQSCGKLLTAEQGIDCAMLELGGWDTHNKQANRLDKQLSELDDGLAQLKENLGEHWQNTLVIVATEFGRTVKENGTQGTDHGTGSALFVTGGAAKGGKVLGKWPGLKEQQLFHGRDLMPTSNSFSWFANLLAQHWLFNDTELQTIFPNIKPYQLDLVK